MLLFAVGADEMRRDPSDRARVAKFTRLPQQHKPWTTNRTSQEVKTERVDTGGEGKNSCVFERSASTAT